MPRQMSAQLHTISELVPSHSTFGSTELAAADIRATHACTKEELAKQRLLEKNRRAQARYRNKQREKGAQIEAEIEALQTELKNASLDAEHAKRHNQLLGDIAELRDSEIKVLQQLCSKANAAAPLPTAQGDVAAKLFALPPSWGGKEMAPHECQQLTTMDGRAATLRWGEHVQRMMILLAPVEGPAPAPEAVAALEECVRHAGAFAWTLSVLNPAAGMAMVSLSVDTLADCGDSYRNDRALWQRKVEAIMLTPEQRERVRILAARHERMIGDLVATRSRHQSELLSLLPALEGDGPEKHLAFIRSGELLDVIRKTQHHEREAWREHSCTLLGRVLTPVQFARFSVASYPIFPRASMIAPCLSPLPAKLPATLDGDAVHTSTSRQLCA